MPVGNLAAMLLWLLELVAASFFLSYGAEHLSARYGGRFVGRTLMSVATTLPEIAIVVYAAAEGSYGIALGAGLGSNLLMMTLGLSLMLLIATTRISRSPLRGVDVSKFRLDKVFLVLTAVVSALLFIDGYTYYDGFLFFGLFVAYLVFAFREMKAETRMSRVRTPDSATTDASHQSIEVAPAAGPPRLSTKAVLGFLAGTLGIFAGAGPFIASMEGFAVDSGVSAVILAVVISPIAGEMPEKVSMMILARKGELGASIAVANVLGSKIFNNTLLLAVAVFGAMASGGFFSRIQATPILGYQMVLTTSVTVLAILPMLRKEIGLKTGAFLLVMYAASLLVQFQLLQVP